MADVHTGVPTFMPPNHTEDEEIEWILRDFIAEETAAAPRADNIESIQWPTQDPTPINEYTTEGYMTMAFPTLFPYGHADLHDQTQREEELGIAEYFDALIRYKDGMFGSHPRYNLLTNFS